MVDLSKTFTRCAHCKGTTSEPRNVCPVCDWPRQHSDETPPPSLTMADPNAKPVMPAQQGAIVQPHIADVAIDSRPVVIPGQAPARLDAIAEVGVIATAPVASALQRLKTLTLAPEDPVDETDEGLQNESPA